MHGEDVVLKHLGCGVIGEWAGIDRAFNIAADGGVFRLGGGNADGRAIFDESEKLRSHIDMESEAAVGAWAVFHPTGMNPVVGSEFTPVGHGRSFKFPTGWFAAEVGFFNPATIVSKAMAVGAVVVFFIENAEVAFWCGCAGCAHGYWSDHQNLRPLHDVNHLVAGRYLYANFGWVGGECCRAIE